MAKKFLFTLSHATSSPMEVIGILKIASNMKAFEDDAEIVVFLLGEGVQLAKKGVAGTISMELEGTQVNVGELVDMALEVGIKFFVCHAFMPGFGVTPDTLIEGAETKSSSYLGELLLDGYVPFSLSI
jgi:predicted peroxiredoxin